MKCQRRYSIKEIFRLQTTLRIQNTINRKTTGGGIMVMVLNATFNNILVLSWRSVLLAEETGAFGENHRPVASHWQNWNLDTIRSGPRSYLITPMVKYFSLVLCIKKTEHGHVIPSRNNLFSWKWNVTVSWL